MSKSYNDEYDHVYIGVDDLDDFYFGCTTYFVKLFIEKLSSSNMLTNIAFLDYPRLVRMNPAVPFKTRGNGAVSLFLRVKKDSEDKLISILKDLVQNYYEESFGREPGIILLSENNIHDHGIMSDYYWKAVSDVILIDHALRLLKKFNAKILSHGRGIVGALGAVSNFFIEGDCTYELIGYSERSSEIMISKERVILMDKLTRPYTFNNIDPDHKKILITPSLGKPIVFGIRGEDPKILMKALEILRPANIESTLIFKTNQGTDHHMIPRKISEARIYRTGLFEGVVSKRPYIAYGGDVFLEIKDPEDPDLRLEVAIYKELGEGNVVARELREGDIIRVGGSIKPLARLYGSSDMLLNTEVLEIIDLKKIFIQKNPSCPRCGSTMKSMGRDKGFKCPKCGYKDPFAKKIYIEVPRNIDVDKKIFKPPPRNMKHLTKPVSRYGLEKICRKDPVSLKNFYNIHKFMRNLMIKI